MLPNYYAILGVSPTASQAEIKKAYYKLARYYHPDKPHGNEEQFKQISYAFETLSDIDKKMNYDSSLEEELNKHRDSELEAIYRSARNWEAKQERERERERIKKEYYQNPDADFIFLNKQDQHDVEANYRRDLYSSEEYDIKADLNKGYNKLNPRTLERFLDLKYFVASEDFLSKPPNPFKRAKKYLSRMNRPYQAYQIRGYELMTDVLQPLWGGGNLLAAAVYLFLFTVTFCSLPLSIPIAYLLKKNQDYHSFSKLIKGAVEIMAFQVKAMEAFSLLGITQLVSTPFTWFVRIPLRGVLTLIKGSESIEDSPHIQRLIKEAEEGLAQEDKTMLRVTIAVLHDKFEHALKHKKRYSKGTSSDEFKVFYSGVEDESGIFHYGVEKEFVLSTLNPHSTMPINERQKQAIRNYLNFFKQPTDDEGKRARETSLSDSDSGINLR